MNADGAAKRVVLGVDIGGTSAKFGLVDRGGRCLSGGAIPTGARRPPEAFFEDLCAAARRLLEGQEGRLAGVGIGAANANFYTGTIERSPNLGWEYVEVRAEIGKHFDVPVAVTNDANAGARTIGDIAPLCGFHDPLYFSKIFKKQYGVAPRYYLEHRLNNTAVRPDSDSVKVKL